MPRPSGPPVNISGQPQREVVRFHVDVAFDAAGAPTFRFEGYTQVRLRDVAGNIVWQAENPRQLVNLQNAQIPAPVRSDFLAILARLDALPDPA